MFENDASTRKSLSCCRRQCRCPRPPPSSFSNKSLFRDHLAWALVLSLWWITPFDTKSGISTANQGPSWKQKTNGSQLTYLYWSTHRYTSTEDQATNTAYTRIYTSTEDQATNTAYTRIYTSTEDQATSSLHIHLYWRSSYKCC